MRDFTGKVAVITGGASGVGRAIGARLVREGARVVLADIDQARLDTVAGEIGAEAGIVVDVTKEASVDALADQVFDRFGAAHLVFNNAGVGLGEAKRKIWDLPLNDWRWGIDVNVLGVVHGIKAFVPRMLAGGEEGVVINTSSTNGGLRSLPNTPIYAATKASVTSISEVLHQQLLRVGGSVRAAVLFPGPNTVEVFQTAWASTAQPYPATGATMRVTRLREFTAMPTPIPVQAVKRGCANGLARQRTTNVPVRACTPPGPTPPEPS